MKKFVYIALIVCLLSSCGSSSTLGAIVSDGTFKRITIGQKPPTEVTDTLHLANVNTSNVKGVTISPNGLYCVVWLKNSSNTKNSVKIYDSVRGNLQYDWDEADIKRIIERNSDFSYKGIERFIFMSIRWQTEENIIIDIQPVISGTGTESLPANVSLSYNLRAKKVVSIEGYTRNSDPRTASGTFPNRDLYNYSISNGNLIIDGNIVNGIPGNVKFADITTIKK